MSLEDDSDYMEESVYDKKPAAAKPLQDDADVGHGIGLKEIILKLNYLFYALQETFDLDDILPTIGEFGKYQKLLVFGICLPACIPCGFCAFNQLFMSDTPEDYWCKIPELLNIPLEERKMLAIPPDMVK